MHARPHLAAALICALAILGCREDKPRRIGPPPPDSAAAAAQVASEVDELIRARKLLEAIAWASAAIDVDAAEARRSLLEGIQAAAAAEERRRGAEIDHPDMDYHASISVALD